MDVTTGALRRGNSAGCTGLRPAARSSAAGRTLLLLLQAYLLLTICSTQAGGWGYGEYTSFLLVQYVMYS